MPGVGIIPYSDFFSPVSLSFCLLDSLCLLPSILLSPPPSMCMSVFRKAYMCDYLSTVIIRVTQAGWKVRFLSKGM